MAQYPDVLPKPLMRQYKQSQEKAFIRTPMQSGYARQRKVKDAVAVMYSVSFRFTKNQLAIFEAWFVHKINNGASEFSMNVSESSGVNLRSVRFTDSYKTTQNSHDLFTVSSTIEMRGVTIMSESALDALI